tara:strand:+ start:43 stop:690 length:648 start_codon:yes stop_codon:yes gene_type:complete
MRQKLIALTALVGFALPMVAEENPKLIEAKKLLERAQTKHRIGEEAEAIDLGRAAAKLGSLEARVLVSGWLLERNAPKTKTKASKSLLQAANSETDAIHMIEQEIAALMKQSQQSQSSGQMSEEQLQLLMMMMQMMGMKPGEKPGQGQGNTPGMSSAGGNTKKPNEATPGNVAGGGVNPDNKIQKLAGRNAQLPKEFQGQLKGFFKGVDELRKKK